MVEKQKPPEPRSEDTPEDHVRRLAGLEKDTPLPPALARSLELDRRAGQTKP